MFMFFLLSDDKVYAVFTAMYFSEECTITNTKAPKIFWTRATSLNHVFIWYYYQMKLVEFDGAFFIFSV